MYFGKDLKILLSFVKASASLSMVKVNEKELYTLCVIINIMYLI